MIPKQTIDAVKITGPAIMILIVGLLWFYDSCFARPTREKLERTEAVLVEIRTTLSRIDERTLLLLREKNVERSPEIQADK